MDQKKLALQALHQMRGDDLIRARNAFQNRTPAQMQEQYGQSGKTCAEIIANYELFDTRIAAAIEWVESKN